MYKVFIYDKPVLIGFPLKNVPKTYQQISIRDVYKIFSILENPKNQGVAINGADVNEIWEQFKAFFVPITAAGGCVKNHKKELLLIYRLSKWDLPKGKLEENEDIPSCALREVEEECGVGELTIEKQLPNTYHCYPLKNGKWALKTTYWYQMISKDDSELVPQTEEGIEKVIWASPQEVIQAKQNTYPSLLDLFDCIGY